MQNHKPRSLVERVLVVAGLGLALALWLWPFRQIERGLRRDGR